MKLSKFENGIIEIQDIFLLLTLLAYDLYNKCINKTIDRLGKQKTVVLLNVFIIKREFRSTQDYLVKSIWNMGGLLETKIPRIIMTTLDRFSFIAHHTPFENRLH